MRSTAFLQGEEKGHLDLPKARKGGFAGGLFAIFVPSPKRERSRQRRNAFAGDRQRHRQRSGAARRRCGGGAAGRVRHGVAAVSDRAGVERARSRLPRLLPISNAASPTTRWRRCFISKAPKRSMRTFELLDVLHAAGLRSLGPVWSRPNMFGHGVPFRCPSSPDTGPGLTDLGKALIGACNRLRILIDLSHLNERGFWDVAEISNAPLVATHSNAHAVSPHSRNLTDRAIGGDRRNRRSRRRQFRHELPASGRPSRQGHAART